MPLKNNFLLLVIYHQKKGSRLAARDLKTRELSDDEIKILKYVNQQYKHGLRPTLTEIEKEMRMTRPTCRRKIEFLLQTEHINIINIGREKRVMITNKGQYLLK